MFSTVVAGVESWLTWHTQRPELDTLVSAAVFEDQKTRADCNRIQGLAAALNDVVTCGEAVERAHNPRPVRRRKRALLSDA